jgi:methionine sulfoxide reductase heme-binding subunit
VVRTAAAGPRPAAGWWRAAVFLLALLPFLLLVRDALTGGLGAEPVERITHRTGWWALTFLLVTLAVTPARRVTGWNRLVQVRRMLGLLAFFYATLHVLTYFGLDLFFDLAFLAEDVLQRPYITVGFTAWPTRGWIRRLGGKRWQRLHRLAYPAAALAVLHFLWLVKADTREPLLFGAVLLALLALRLPPVAGRLGRLRGAPGAARGPESG